MNKIITYALWAIAMLVISVLIVYGFYMIIVLMLFRSQAVWLAVAGTMVCIYVWWRLVQAVE